MAFSLKFSVLLSVTCAFAGLILCPSESFAQTTTTYSYDAKGRMISSSATAGESKTVTYDDASNITSIDVTAGGGNSGGGGNVNPTCPNITVQPITVYGFSYAYFDGVLSCSDSDGGTLSLSSITQPTNGASASIYTGFIYVANLPYFGNTVMTRTVSDGQGGSVTSTITITN